MDAEIVVSALIEKLQKESISTMISQCPMLQMQVQTAIDKLHLLKRRLKVAQDLEASPGHSMNIDHQRMVKLLQAAYSADDAADTLLTGEAFQIKTKIDGSNKRFQWPCIRSLWSRQTTSTPDREMKTFEDEFREYLSSYDHLVEMTSDIKDDVVDNNNDTGSGSQDDHEGEECWPQRWEMAEMTSEIKDEAFDSNNDTGSGSQNDHEGEECWPQRWERINDFCLEETDVVGHEEQIKKLVDLNPSSPQVMAVFGEGGSGKTTLVRAAYNILLATRKFNGCAWVHVPNLFRARYVLSDILKQIKRNINIPIPRESFEVDATVSEGELIGELTEIIKLGGFLIVIEDVESPQAWEVLSRGVLYSSNSGSRIIITTRNKDVASCAAGDSILEVCQLNNERSWELFLKKVHIEEDVLNKSELIILKDQILKVCGGLPSRIVLLGGLLSTKGRSCDEWSRVIELANNIGGDLFALSYHDLPSQVKPCFLYMGIFPRGFEIPVERLIHLWVSEGFLRMPSDLAVETVPEDQAETYFEELVIRNMIQVRWRLDGSPQTCRMPGVLYDIFSPKAAEWGFFYRQLHLSHELSDKKTIFPIRRLAKSMGIKNDFPSSFFHFENLRSYVGFDTRIPDRSATEIGTLLNKIINRKGFVLLKVLDLEGVYKPVLSEDVIGKLLLLSYLGLRSTAIDYLPSCVGNLPCLETLDVKHTIIHDLPTSIWQAKKLRHLYLNWGCSSNFSSSSLPSEPPTNLNTLWGLSIDDGGIGFLKMSTELRKLGLTCTSISTAKATAEWVSQLTKLQSLKLRSIRKGSHDIEVFHLGSLTMGRHHKLQHLYLTGSLTYLQYPPNLKMITLSQSGFEADWMRDLGGLPHLQILELLGCTYNGKIMTCRGGEFPKLLVLKLWALQVEEWIVEEGAMPCLRELEFRRCWSVYNNLRSTGWQHLTALKRVALIGTQLAVSDFVGSEEKDIYVYKTV